MFAKFILLKFNINPVNFMKSKQAQDAKLFATNKGLKEDDINAIFSKIPNSFSGEVNESFNNKLKEQVKKALSEPKAMEFIEEKS